MPFYFPDNQPQSPPITAIHKASSQLRAPANLSPMTGRMANYTSSTPAIIPSESVRSNPKPRILPKLSDKPKTSEIEDITIISSDEKPQCSSPPHITEDPRQVFSLLKKRAFRVVTSPIPFSTRPRACSFLDKHGRYTRIFDTRYITEPMIESEAKALSPLETPIHVIESTVSIEMIDMVARPKT